MGRGTRTFKIDILASPKPTMGREIGTSRIDKILTSPTPALGSIQSDMKNKILIGRLSENARKLQEDVVNLVQYVKDVE